MDLVNWDLGGVVEGRLDSEHVPRNVSMMVRYRGMPAPRAEGFEIHDTPRGGLHNMNDSDRRATGYWNSSTGLGFGRVLFCFLTTRSSTSRSSDCLSLLFPYSRFSRSHESVFAVFGRPVPRFAFTPEECTHGSNVSTGLVPGKDSKECFHGAWN